MAGVVPSFPGYSLPWWSKLSRSLCRQSSSGAWLPVGAGAALALGLSWSIFKAPILVDKKAGWEAVVRDQLTEAFLPFASNLSAPFATLSMATMGESTEPQTGVVFPGEVEGNGLIGIGLRKKKVVFKNITVYAYGVYVDPDSVKSTLGSKYAGSTPAELSGKEEVFDDVTKADVGMTVRLSIVFGRLNISSIRSAFEESVGKGLKKFSGDDNKELLGQFTSMFTDDLKLPKGTTIDLSRLPGQVLVAKIDGREMGTVESALLCQSVFDLYIGEEAFDKDARKVIGQNLGSFLSS